MAKKDVLDKAIDSINSHYGANTIVTIDANNIPHLESTSTGSYGLDVNLGGGLPRGKLCELFGLESCGKTTLALHMIKSAQKLGKVVYIDLEHSLDIKYAQRIGVDVGELLFSQPIYAESVFEIAELLAGTSSVSMIVVDSVASLSPKAEVEGSSGDANMGVTPKLVAQHMRKIAPIADFNKCSMVYINQLRMKMQTTQFSSPYVTPGGMALKYYAILRLNMARVKTLKDSNGKAYGINSRIRIAKNKVGIPFLENEVEISHGLGINNNMELLTIGLANKVVEKSGAWYSFNSERMGQGAINACAYIESNSTVRDAIIASMEPSDIGISLDDGVDEGDYEEINTNVE